jgi:2'-5' RNA ligase
MRALKALKVIMEHGKNSKAVRKVHTSAVMISPPQADWPQIQEIRKIYDKSYVRWMPHINLLYPFVHNDEFSTAVDRVKAAVASIKPFTVQFKQFDFFKHGKASYTMWLKPEPNEEIKELQQTLEKAFPGFEDLSTISDAGFTPHLSVGQWKNEAELLKKKKEFESTFKTIDWDITEVCLISRTAEDPFEVRYTVPLGGGDIKIHNLLAPVPRAELKTRVFIGNLPFTVTEDDLKKELESIPGISCQKVTLVKDPKGKPKGFGFVEFDTEEQKLKAVEYSGKVTLSGRQIVINPVNG